MQLTAHVLLSPRESLLLAHFALTAEQHVVDVRFHVVLNVDVVVPVFLSQFLGLIVCSRNVANLAFDVFEFGFATPNVSSEDRADEDAHKEEEKGDSSGLCGPLDQATRHFGTQHCEGVVRVLVNFDPDHLLHGLEKCAH